VPVTDIWHTLVLHATFPYQIYEFRHGNEIRISFLHSGDLFSASGNNFIFILNEE